MSTPQEEYMAAAHAMQSGVAQKMEFDTAETTPKHLRVGVNVALSEHGSLVSLLIEKGIITHEEYLSAITAGMQREAAGYEKLLSDHYGTKITLG